MNRAKIILGIMIVTTTAFSMENDEDTVSMSSTLSQENEDHEDEVAEGLVEVAYKPKYHNPERFLGINSRKIEKIEDLFVNDENKRQQMIELRKTIEQYVQEETFSDGYVYLDCLLENEETLREELKKYKLLVSLCKKQTSPQEIIESRQTKVEIPPLVLGQQDTFAVNEREYCSLKCKVITGVSIGIVAVWAVVGTLIFIN